MFLWSPDIDWWSFSGCTQSFSPITARISSSPSNLELHKKKDGWTDVFLKIWHISSKIQSYKSKEYFLKFLNPLLIGSLLVFSLNFLSNPSKINKIPWSPWWRLKACFSTWPNSKDCVKTVWLLVITDTNSILCKQSILKHVVDLALRCVCESWEEIHRWWKFCKWWLSSFKYPIKSFH